MPQIANKVGGSWCEKCDLTNFFPSIFIGPKSDHCLALSFTESLSFCSFLDLIDVTLPCEDSGNLSLPAVVSFDSHVVGVVTKQKPCC